MILKSFIVEKNISLLDKYFCILIYGENIGLKDDIKKAAKIYFKDYERIVFNHDEVVKNEKLLNEQINNTSLFSKKKIIIINEVSDKIKNVLKEFLDKPNSDTKIFLFAQNLEKKSSLRRTFEKDNKVAAIACYQDNERTLSNYIRIKLDGYSGLNQQILNFLIINSSLDRKTLSQEIEKIKSLFLDKKIKIENLPELLNNNNNSSFDDLRDFCFSAEKDKLNRSLGNVHFQNESTYFYLAILSNRVEKLLSLNNELKDNNNIEDVISKVKPPIFWKDKPIFYKQIKLWNKKKLEEARKMIFRTELQIKTISNINNSTLLKNLIIDLYETATATS